MNQMHPVLHLRYDGRSLDLPLADLDLGPAATNEQVVSTLARYLEISPVTLRDYAVDRHQTGNMTVRPNAVYG